MKNIILLPLAAVLIGGALSGCFTIENTKIAATGEHHVFVSNYGWYLFNCIPLVCGNAAPDACIPFVMFRNDVTMDKIQRRFMDRAKSLSDGEIFDLSYSNDDSVLFEVPGLEFPLPVPYILTYHEIMLSGGVK